MVGAGFRQRPTGIGFTRHQDGKQRNTEDERISKRWSFVYYLPLLIPRGVVNEPTAMSTHYCHQVACQLEALVNIKDSKDGMSLDPSLIQAPIPPHSTDNSNHQRFQGDPPHLPAPQPHRLLDFLTLHTLPFSVQKQINETNLPNSGRPVALLKSRFSTLATKCRFFHVVDEERKRLASTVPIARVVVDLVRSSSSRRELSRLLSLRCKRFAVVVNPRRWLQCQCDRALGGAF